MYISKTKRRLLLLAFDIIIFVIIAAVFYWLNPDKFNYALEGYKELFS